MTTTIKPSDIYRTPGAKTEILDLLRRRGYQFKRFGLYKQGETYIKTRFNNPMDILVAEYDSFSPRIVVEPITHMDWWE